MRFNVTEPFGRCRLSTTSTINENPDANIGKDATTTTRITKGPRRKIRTLDPSKLVEDDYIDFSLKVRPALGILLRRDLSSDPSYQRPFRSADFSAHLWSSDRFPPGTHGFLYYHVPPCSSPLSGELRFRLTPSRDPASFAEGSDLFTERSMPWRYPLYKIVHRVYWTDIVALLLQDGLVSQHTLDLVTAAVAPLYHANTTSAQHEGTALSDARHPAFLSTTPVLSAFGQEFRVSVGQGTENFLGIFASPDTILTHCMRLVTASWVLVQGKRIAYCPFKGNVPRPLTSLCDTSTVGGGSESDVRL